MIPMKLFARSPFIPRACGVTGALSQFLPSCGTAAGLRRAAAEAPGRLGEKRPFPALLKSRRSPARPRLEHSLIYALIEIADPVGTAED